MAGAEHFAGAEQLLLLDQLRHGGFGDILVAPIVLPMEGNIERPEE